jgi:hypothetical protein
MSPNELSFLVRQPADKGSPYKRLSLFDLRQPLDYLPI